MFSFFSLLILSRGFFSLRGFFFLSFFSLAIRKKKEKKKGWKWKYKKEMIYNNSIVYFTYVYNLPLQLVSHEREKKRNIDSWWRYLYNIESYSLFICENYPSVFNSSSHLPPKIFFFLTLTKGWNLSIIFKTIPFFWGGGGGRGYLSSHFPSPQYILRYVIKERRKRRRVVKQDLSPSDGRGTNHAKKKKIQKIWFMFEKTGELDT